MRRVHGGMSPVGADRYFRREVGFLDPPEAHRFRSKHDPVREKGHKTRFVLLAGGEEKSGSLSEDPGMDREIGHLARLVRLNHQFHSTLYEASGRRHLCDLNHTLRYRTQHYLHAYMSDSGHMALAQEGHRAILQACKERDVEAAAMLVYRHVAEVGQSLVEYVRQKELGQSPEESENRI